MFLSVKKSYNEQECDVMTSKKIKVPKKKQPSSQKRYMPDETGHMVEWLGDHPVFVKRWTKDDEEEETGKDE